MLKRWETVWCHITELDELNGFKGEIIGRLFEKYLNYCKSGHQTTNPCSAKEVFDYIEFDWVNMFRDIKQKFPELKALYMAVPSEMPYSFNPNIIHTNDAEGKFFLVEDRIVKVDGCIEDIHSDDNLHSYLQNLSKRQMPKKD